MKKTINLFSRVLVALVLCAGLVVTSCTEGPLEKNENTEQGGNEDQGEQDDPAEEDKQIVSKGPITLVLENVTATAVTFAAQLDVDTMADYQEVGLIYSTENELDIENEDAVSVKINRQEYSETFTGLQYNTKYYYTVYLIRNGVYSYGEVKEFTTENINGTDLTKNSPANCYIVSEAGTYIFKTIKGNSFTSVGTVDKAEVLWESFGTSTTPSVGHLIENVYWTKDCVIFETASTFTEGNAVIAAKDANGKILWSWHIWLTDQPEDQVYNNNAGTMMDRNLGATCATPGDAGALGLLYQWGRKDPFLGSSSISESIVATSTINWPSAVSSTEETGTIAYVTANPTTFVTGNNNNYDWYYTGTSSTDNTRWQSEKTIYDPCPAGWRVPDGGGSGVWSTAGFAHTTYNGTYEGISFNISSPSTTWYPASGYRIYSGGGLNDVGHYGIYCSVTPNSYSACGLLFYYTGYVDPSYYYYRASGCAVRCLQE